jgi:thymidylate synthase (FAD)
MGDDLSVVRSARVSHDADPRTGIDAGKDEKLIAYLASHEHMTPFESVVLTLEIKCPIFLARQFHRHRTQSINEISARYTELPEEFYLPRPEHIGTQSPTNKQGRIIDKPNLDAHNKINVACLYAFDIYARLVDSGCPREIARTVLPMATYTRYFTTMNLRNYTHFIKLRDHHSAQWEAQQYARAMTQIAMAVAPASTGALLDMSDEEWQ